MIRFRSGKIVNNPGEFSFSPTVSRAHARTHTGLHVRYKYTNFAFVG